MRGNRILAGRQHRRRCWPCAARAPASSTPPAPAVLPGFIESHMHVFPGGAGLASLQLDGVHGLDRAGRSVRAWAAAHPDDPIIYGVQASYQHPARAADPPPARPRPARPAARACTPSTATRSGPTPWRWSVAGLLHGRALPPGNEIVMGADGLATGELREPAAYAPLMALLPSGGREKLGITTGRDPEPPPTPEPRAPPTAPPSAAAWNGAPATASPRSTTWTATPTSSGLLRGAGRRRRAVLPDPRAVPHEERHDAGRPRGGGPGDARPLAAPTGSPATSSRSSSTACSIRPPPSCSTDYEGQPGNRGQPLFTPGADRRRRHPGRPAGLPGRRPLDRRCRRAPHARRLRRRPRAPTARATAATASSISSSIDPADIPRFQELGVVASMQPLHAPGPLSYPGHEMMALLGEAREPWTFAWRTLREAGARLCFASDWPVSPVDPLLSIQAALVRKPWRPGQPEQAQTLEQALAGYTSDNAWVEFAEDRKGHAEGGLPRRPRPARRRHRGHACRGASASLKVRATVCDGSGNLRGVGPPTAAASVRRRATATAAAVSARQTTDPLAPRRLDRGDLGRAHHRRLRQPGQARSPIATSSGQDGLAALVTITTQSSP